MSEGAFPPLDRAVGDGEGFEARFNAFKIPESNFLVFEATVKSCRGGICQPVYQLVPKYIFGEFTLKIVF